MSYTQLPPNVLCTIWGNLSKMQDRVTASHTCRRLRDVALDTPELWTLLNFVTTERDAKCDCPCWERCPRRSNGRLVLELLKRTKNEGLPLNMKVTVETSCVDTASLCEFARLFGASGALPRLKTLHIEYRDFRTLICFLDPFEHLPALKTLTTKYKGPEDGFIPAIAERHCMAFIPQDSPGGLARPLRLLALSRLVIDTGLHWSFASRPLMLPNLESMKLAIYDPRTLASLVAKSPRLQQLDVDARDGVAEFYKMGCAKKYLDTIPRVVIHGIDSRKAEHWACQLWLGSQRESCSFRYPLRFRDLPLMDCFEALSELDTIRRMQIVAYRNDYVMFSGTNALGRTREVVLPSDLFPIALRLFHIRGVLQNVEEFVLQDLLVERFTSVMWTFYYGCSYLFPTLSRVFVRGGPLTYTVLSGLLVLLAEVSHVQTIYPERPTTN